MDPESFVTIGSLIEEEIAEIRTHVTFYFRFSKWCTNVRKRDEAWSITKVISSDLGMPSMLLESVLNDLSGQ